MAPDPQGGPREGQKNASEEPVATIREVADYLKAKLPSINTPISSEELSKLITQTEQQSIKNGLGQLKEHYPSVAKLAGDKAKVEVADLYTVHLDNKTIAQEFGNAPPKAGVVVPPAQDNINESRDFREMSELIRKSTLKELETYFGDLFTPEEREKLIIQCDKDTKNLGRRDWQKVLLSEYELTQKAALEHGLKYSTVNKIEFQNQKFEVEMNHSYVNIRSFQDRSTGDTIRPYRADSFFGFSGGSSDPDKVYEALKMQRQLREVLNKEGVKIELLETHR
jgi:hypothetical protein